MLLNVSYSFDQKLNVLLEEVADNCVIGFAHSATILLYPSPSPHLIFAVLVYQLIFAVLVYDWPITA